MRFLSRLHVCAGAVMLLVLYFWVQPSSYINSSGRTIWRSNAHRIIVFGDDWSDTGTYQVSPPRRSSVITRDPDRGEVWVEALCRELTCDIDNFARSIAADAKTSPIGSLVDAEILSQATNGKSNGGTVTSFDFKTQVQQFLAYNKGNRYFSGRPRRIDERTIFTVYFGLWDLLEYATLQKEFAMIAIDNSIAELFQELGVLSEEAMNPIKVVLPLMVDVTFLPRVQSRRNASQEHYAQSQHHLVFLWTYWNNVLFQTASRWRKGEIFMPDPHALIMDQVRARQLYSPQISVLSEDDDDGPLFKYIEEPCLSSPPGTGTTLQAAPVEKCRDSARHLFWDDLHLGGTAHELIGFHAASLLQRNRTVNSRRFSAGYPHIARPGWPQGAGFDLEFPPGY